MGLLRLKYYDKKFLILQTTDYSFLFVFFWIYSNWDCLSVCMLCGYAAV